MQREIVSWAHGEKLIKGLEFRGKIESMGQRGGRKGGDRICSCENADMAGGPLGDGGWWFWLTGRSGRLGKGIGNGPIWRVERRGRSWELREKVRWELRRCYEIVVLMVRSMEGLVIFRG